MSFKPPLPFYLTKNINPFLNSRIPANHDKGERFNPIVNSYTIYCSSSVNYLL